jgi:hypothetical protein
MVRRNVCRDIRSDNFGIDTGQAPTLASRVGFDGAGPERSSLPTWRGVLTTVIVIVVLVALIFVAYSFAVTVPRAPQA